MMFGHEELHPLSSFFWMFFQEDLVWGQDSASLACALGEAGIPWELLVGEGWDLVDGLLAASRDVTQLPGNLRPPLKA